MDYSFAIMSKNSLSILRSQKHSPRFLSKSFMVLIYITSMTHLVLGCVMIALKGWNSRLTTSPLLACVWVGPHIFLWYLNAVQLLLSTSFILGLEIADFGENFFLVFQDCWLLQHVWEIWSKKKTWNTQHQVILLISESIVSLPHSLHLYCLVSFVL